MYIVTPVALLKVIFSVVCSQCMEQQHHDNTVTTTSTSMTTT